MEISIFVLRYKTDGKDNTMYYEEQAVYSIKWTYRLTIPKFVTRDHFLKLYTKISMCWSPLPR